MFKYVIQKTNKSFCYKCNKKVDLLASDNLTSDNLREDAMFYICWNCKTVAQVGVGPVKRESL